MDLVDPHLVAGNSYAKAGQYQMAAAAYRQNIKFKFPTIREKTMAQIKLFNWEVSQMEKNFRRAQFSYQTSSHLSSDDIHELNTDIYNMIRYSRL